MVNYDFKKLINANFWISEFVILLLSNYYRWIDRWTIVCTFITLMIVLINVQYCVLHMRKLFKSRVKWYIIVLLELSFTIANVITVLSNMFCLARSYQVHLGFIAILTVLLCPMIVINQKY